MTLLFIILIVVAAACIIGDWFVTRDCRGKFVFYVIWVGLMLLIGFSVLILPQFR